MSIGFQAGFLHLEPPTLHIGPPLLPVGRTVYDFNVLLLYCFAILLFYFDWVPGRGCCISSHHPCMSAHHLHSLLDVFASRAAPLLVGPPFSPVRRTIYYFTISLFLYFISFGFQAGGFCISGRQPCMSTHVFLHLGPSILDIRHVVFRISGR